MLDPIEGFAKQFTRVENGYLYYPGPNAEGKLITVEEYDRLVADWRRLAGTAGMWKIAGAFGLAIVAWTFLSVALELPDWANTAAVLLAATLLTSWVFWASFAPRRLVRNRAAVAPPRPAGQARRDARSALHWPLVIFVVIFSGALFIAKLRSPEASLTWWAWLIGSGLAFGSYSWIAIQKFRDRRR